MPKEEEYRCTDVLLSVEQSTIKGSRICGKCLP